MLDQRLLVHASKKHRRVPIAGFRCDKAATDEISTIRTHTVCRFLIRQRKKSAMIFMESIVNILIPYRDCRRINNDFTSTLSFISQMKLRRLKSVDFTSWDMINRMDCHRETLHLRG